MDFEQLGISSLYCDILHQSGIHVPTEIQVKCIEPILFGRDVIAEAQTGTGKTLAFLLPIFEQLDIRESSVQALVVTPTRELAIQITHEAEKLAQAKGFGVLAVYGGRELAGQMKKLKQGVQLVVATPGRMLDHLERGNISLSALRMAVLDEADEMLLMGFKNEVEAILAQMPKQKQLMCFSATMNSGVKKLAYRYMQNPEILSVEKESVTLQNICQFVVETPEPLKRDALCAVLDEDRPFMAIIFCRTKRRAEELFDVLRQRGYDAAVIHSDIAQNKRERIMKTFRKGDLQYLVATDVAARGLDITGVTHIYNYDMPESAEDYIHRIGRTGRKGDEGQTCMFVTPKEGGYLKTLEDAIRMSLPRRKITSAKQEEN